MAQVSDCDLRELVVSNNTFGPQEIELLAGAIAQNPVNQRILRDAVYELKQQQERTEKIQQFNQSSS